MKETRFRKADAVGALQKAYGQGTYAALIDLLEAELAEAHEEMASASDTITIWRAQGRVAEIKDLLASVTPRSGTGEVL